MRDVITVLTFWDFLSRLLGWPLSVDWPAHGSHQLDGRWTAMPENPAAERRGGRKELCIKH